MKPSAYPDPSSYVSPTDTLPPDYEVLVELYAIVNEPSATSPSNPSTAPPQPEATLRIIQGPLSPTQTSDKPYHAFISTRDINIPLLPTTTVSPLPNPNPPAFRIHLQNRVFDITLNPNTEPELVEGFITIVKWFCNWNPTPSPHISATHFPSPTAESPTIESPTSQPSSSKDRFASLGDAGVRFIEKAGTALNTKITTNLDARTDVARGEPAREISVGGKITSAVLGGTSKVIGAGASLASSTTEKISDAVANGVSNSSINRSLSEAPEGSFKKRFHNNLMSGLLAFGRIYVAADTQGKIIIESAGNSAAELAGAKYGDEAQSASRHIGRITLDGYRILRFPKKLGATAIVKGAFKSKFGSSRAENPTKHTHPFDSTVEEIDPSQPASTNETQIKH